MMELVEALIDAKRKNEFQPILMLLWPDQGFAILREPKVCEAEFYYQLMQMYPADAAGFIFNQCILHESDGLGVCSRQEAGFLYTCVESLVRWAVDKPEKLNGMIEAERSSVRTLSGFIDSHVRAVAPNYPFEHVSEMTYSQLLQALFSVERVLTVLTEGKTPLFRLITPQMAFEERQATLKHKVDKIVRESADAPQEPGAPLDMEQLRQLQTARGQRGWRPFLPDHLLRNKSLPGNGR